MSSAEQSNISKPELYRQVGLSLIGLLAGERNFIANAANMAALLFNTLPAINWAGFYLLRSPDELVLGPFMGNPACTRIAVGRGVCGAAAATGKTIIVPDVHAFPGHIACDIASRAELVAPLIQDRKTLGVLDLDSPNLGRFDAQDQAGIENLVAVFLAASDLFA